MKNNIRSLIAVLSLASALSVARAADEKPGASEEKKKLRVLAAPERRVIVQTGEKAKVEKETVAFLGIETSPVSATVSAQLGLQRGTGLVVNHIVPKSAAVDVLREHDILLKLDDQILIETRQLSVLIRTHKEGDEVELTYLRGGQKATTKVKLGKQEVPKFSSAFSGTAKAFALTPGAGAHFELLTPDVLENREDVDRLLSLIQRAPGAPDTPAGGIPPPVRIQIDHNGGPGFRAMSVHTGNSNIVYSDDEGSMELRLKDGAKSLVAKNAKGEPLFSGSVTTPEERKALPAEVRERLEKLEGMHNITFHTDRDFQGAEMKIMRPRGIALPLPFHVRVPAPQSAFY